MITFSLLHAYGRLGNQLFQIAACLGLAARTGDDVVLPYWEYSGAVMHPPRQVPSPIDIRGMFIYHEPGFPYRELPLKLNIDLRGYFQSYRYFEHIDAEIRKRFRFWRRSSLQQNTCAIHVRRGDYLHLAVHPVMPMTYYLESMDYMRSIGVTRFLIFSDDIAWCREAFKTDDVEFSRKSNCVSDLAAMSDCHHFIIANSSYSWWGAYLGDAEDKQVIYPGHWFAADYADYDTRDLCPPSWRRVAI